MKDSKLVRAGQLARAVQKMLRTEMGSLDLHREIQNVKYELDSYTESILGGGDIPVLSVEKCLSCNAPVRLTLSSDNSEVALECADNCGWKLLMWRL